MAYLLGRFAGDGWFQKRGIAIGTNKKGESEEIFELMENIFGREPKIKKRKYKDGHELYIIAFYSIEIEKEFRELLGNPKKNKSKTFTVPEIISTNVFLRRKFISGIFDAEGSFRMWRNKPRASMNIYNKQAAIFINKSLREDEIKSSLSFCSDGACRIDITGKSNVDILKEKYHYPRGGKS